MFEKLQGLKKLRGRPEFGSLAAAIKRARNILQQAAAKGWQPTDGAFAADALAETAEKELWSEVERVRPVLEKSIQSRQYESALLELAGLKNSVDNFFNGVMVMVDDARTREMRLSLLKNVRDLFDQMCDFSKLQTSGNDAPSH